MGNELCTAIQQKKTVKFNYNGGAVIVEPFCFGTGADGKEALKGYLLAGGEAGWKIFDAAKIADVKMTNVTFGLTRADYKPNDGMKSIQCQVA